MRGLRVFAAILFLGAARVTAAAEVLEFSQLDGWGLDDHRYALQAFLETCDKISAPEWGPVCTFGPKALGSPEAARSFFEMFFLPVLLDKPPALFTGYYEPELDGSLVRTSRFSWPIYRRPPELRDGQVYYDRAAIEAGALGGRGLEIAWLEDPVEVYFLHVQGSGRVRLPDGSVMRVGYAGRNGHAYRSSGQALVAGGVLNSDQVSAEEIQEWVRANGRAGKAFLNHNPSYVFFRKLPKLSSDQGPIGALGRSLTTLRSVAVDPDYTPLGAPIWVEKDGSQPIRSLMVAQDTGGAIKGPQRADIFFGTGDVAGRQAGRVKDGGRMVVLLPIDLAYATLPDS